MKHKAKLFCKIASIRGGFSLRCDPETFAAIYGMAMIKKSAFFRSTDADLRVINALTLFAAQARREAAKYKTP
jgi:hypothetical protein